MVERLITTPELQEEKSRNLRVAAFCGDLGGCRYFRLLTKFNAMRSLGVTYKEAAWLPSAPGADPFHLLVTELSKYDIVIIQRCYFRNIVGQLRSACDYLNIPLVFETDDDYLHIEPDNPAYLSMIPKNITESCHFEHEKLVKLAGEAQNDPVQYAEYVRAIEENKQKIEEVRQLGLQNYKEIISMMDLVVVSTEELKRTLYPYNKNIFVSENNISEVPPFRAFDPEQAFINPQTGMVDIPINQGLVNLPAYSFPPGSASGEWDTSKIIPLPRVGYSSTVTHWGQDFNSIMSGWGKIIETFAQNCWFVYLGWDRFVHWHLQYAGYKPAHYVDEQTGEKKVTWIPDSDKRQLPRRLYHIPDSGYDLYFFNLRNLDIGIAPLAPTLFNMAKSDIKAVEYGAWGIPAVLPRFQTYARHWKDGENCLMYTGQQEFVDQLARLIQDHSLRAELGAAAFKYVSENRLERFHIHKLYKVFCDLCDSKNRLKQFAFENKETETCPR